MKLRAMLMFLLLNGAGLAAAPRDTITPAELYDRADRACVELLVDGRLTGSGWFAFPDGLIVTAGHAMRHRNGKRLEIISPVAGRMDAEFVAIDRGHDIALLRVKPAASPYPFFRVADAQPTPGEEIFLYASANFRHKLMLRGSVARRGTTFEYLSNEKNYVNFYHASAPAPPGTSGGCWLDLHGRVVGNQSAFMTVNKAGAGIAMLAPPQAITALIASQKSTTPTTPQCAFEELWTQNVDYIKHYPPRSAGLVPVLIQKDGVAQKAGLSGDTLIVGLEDQPIAYTDQLMTAIRAKKPGDTVTLTIMHIDDHKISKIKIQLAALD